jgi:NAD-dependent SIR2 family protein deacetylase
MNRTVSQSLDQAARWLDDAAAVLVGAGAGLSVAAGVDFTSEASFARDFPGMLHYGFRRKLDLMGLVGLPMELQWGYYLPHVREVRFGEVRPGVYSKLLALVSGVGDYFVKTTNADGLFERNGFAAERIFTPQGDYARYQCLQPCSDETWLTEPLFARFIPLIDRATQKLPPGNYPACPRCGGRTFLNVRGGEWFVEAPYALGAERYRAWLSERAAKKVVVLDVGSGFNTPTWIRWPAEALVRTRRDVRLVRINLQDPEVPDDIADRSVSLAMSADEAIDQIARRSTRGRRELAQAG